MNDKDAYYFSHDANARREDKCVALIAEYGLAGYGRFWVIVEILREQPEYRIDVGSKFAYAKIADELKMTRQEAESFIAACVNDFELFKSDGCYLWSESLDRRMETWESTRKALSERGKKGAEKSWSNRRKMAQASESDAQASKSDTTAKPFSGKEIKENKEKREEIKGSGATAPAPTKPPPKPKPVFVKPTPEECIQHFREKGYIDPENEGQKFWNWYEQNDWRVGKKRIPMTLWPLSASNWNIKNKQDQQSGRYVKHNEIHPKHNPGLARAQHTVTPDRLAEITRQREERQRQRDQSDATRGRDTSAYVSH